MPQQTIETEIVNEKSNRENYWLAFFILVIAYILSPIDLIPDFIPIIGWLDDIGIGGGLLGASFQQLLKKYF